MGLLTHVKLGLEKIEAETASSTTTPVMTTTTMMATTEAVGAESSLRDGDRFFDVGEALKMIGNCRQ